MKIEEYQKAEEYILKIVKDITVKREIININITEVMAMLYSKIGDCEAKNIDFDIICSDSLKELPLNAEEINSVLGNLIDNAIAELESVEVVNKSLWLEINKYYDYYTIKVGNYGHISSDKIEKVFTSGYTTKENHQGLGLSIINEIISKHNGTIKIDNDHDNIVFTIRIPYRERV